MLTATLPDSVVWASVSPATLAGVRTDFLRSIDLARIPADARRAIVQELSARRRESWSLPTGRNLPLEVTMTYDQAFTELTQTRSYGPRYARHLLHHAAAYGRVVDELPRRTDGSRPGVQVCATNDAGTRFAIRDVTISALGPSLSA